MTSYHSIDKDITIEEVSSEENCMYKIFNDEKLSVNTTNSYGVNKLDSFNEKVICLNDNNNYSFSDSNSVNLLNVYVDNDDVNYAESNLNLISQIKNIKQSVNLNNSQIGDFNLLKKLIDSSINNPVINIDCNYVYNKSDTITRGILINKNITINGNGFTIDAQRKTSIFDIISDNVVLKNIKFISGMGHDYSGAISWKGDNGIIINCTFESNSGAPGALLMRGANCKVINCTFKDNKMNSINLGGAICWRGENGTIINSIFSGTQSPNDGGAIFWSALNARIINCTFSKNNALNGGAIEFGNYHTLCHNSQVINSTFIHNSAQGGSAISNVGAKNVTIDGCEFIENSASYGILNGCLVTNSIFYKNNGFSSSNQFSSLISGSFDKCIFIDNVVKQECSAVISGNNITNCIFLNNVAKKGCKNNIVSAINLNYNWFGNTYEDYNVVPAENSKIENWLFLNVTHEKLMHVGEKMHVPFVFQLWNGTDILDYDSSKVYHVNLNLSSTNGELNKLSSVVGEDVLYTANSVGNGTVTAKFFDRILNIDLICKKSTEIVASNSITIFVDKTVNFTGSEFSAILNPIEAGNLTYSTDNESILNVTKDGFCGLNGGVANIIVEFKETVDYAPSRVLVPVYVLKFNAEIIVENSITMYYNDIKKIMAELVPNEGNLIYQSLDENIVTVNDEGLISTVGAGTTNINVIFEGNGKYYATNKTITITVNKINSTIQLNKDIEFTCGESDYVLVSVEGAIRIKAFVLNHPEALLNVGGGVITVSGLNVGNYTLVVNTIPDKNHESVSVSTRITVNKITSNIIENHDLTKFYDEHYLFSVRIISPFGSYDSGQKVKFTIGNNNYESITNYNGYAYLNTVLQPGNYVVKSSYGDNEVSNVIKIIATLHEKDMKISSSDINRGETESIQVVLPKDATGKVSTIVNGNEYYANVNEGIGNIIIPNLKYGNYNIGVAYSGDSKYNPVKGTTSFHVEKTIDLSAPDVTKYYSGSERFVVTLNDENDNPINNANIKISINGRDYIKTTDNMGYTSIAINLNSGIYHLTTSYEDTKVYSTVTINPTVVSHDFSKIFKNDTQYYGNFTDSRGNLLKNTPVEFNINGVYYTRTTNNQGIAKMNINLNPGTYILTAKNPVTNEMQSSTITVLSSIVENHDLVKYYKNDSQYRVRLLDGQGRPVGKGVSIEFNINGVFYTRSSDEYGYVQLNINLDPGNYIITANYNGLMASNWIMVLPILYAKDVIMNYQDGSKFKVSLFDGQGNPYSGQTISFNINGVLYDRITDSNGIASLNINIGPGNYIITSSYDTSKISNEIIVNPTYQPTQQSSTNHNQQSSSTKTYIGNTNSKIFHNPSCPSVKKMKSSNKITFYSRNSAINSGYRPCKNCNP